MLHGHKRPIPGRLQRACCATEYLPRVLACLGVTVVDVEFAPLQGHVALHTEDEEEDEEREKRGRGKGDEREQ